MPPTATGLPKEVKGVVIAECHGEQPRASSRARARAGGAAGGQDAGRDRRRSSARAVEQADREKGAVLHVLRPNGDVDFVILQVQ